jgi:uncharacterized protein
MGERPNSQEPTLTHSQLLAQALAQIWIGRVAQIWIGADTVDKLAFSRAPIRSTIVESFDTRMPVRQATEFAMDNLSGVCRLEYVARSARNDVSNPAFLADAERFVTWLRGQAEVNSVISLTDAIKRLHKAMHDDYPAQYRLPTDQNLAAQMLLMYEMSLPFGMDLGDQVTVDKTATRIAVTLGRLDTQHIREFKSCADPWWSSNATRSALIPSV